MRFARDVDLWQAPLVVAIASLERRLRAGRSRPAHSPSRERCQCAPQQVPYWPTETLALGNGSAWVACKEQARIVRVSLPQRPPDGDRASSHAPVTAVAVGFGSRLGARPDRAEPRADSIRGRIRVRSASGSARTPRTTSGSGPARSGSPTIRAGRAAGLAGDQQGVARIAVGDGPADMVFAGTRAWLLTHRDNALHRIDTTSNHATRLATRAAAAPQPSAWR